MRRSPPVPECAVRPYRPADRAALCRICYDCGLMGESIDPLFGSEALFTDYWMTYYLEFEPEAAFVATEDDVPVGYLVGCTDTRRFEDVQRTVVWPRLYRRFFTGRYGVPVRLLRFMWRTLRSQVRDTPLEPPLDAYPAHLHMNLAAEYRGRGHGARLMERYLEYLRTRGVPGVHLITTDRNTVAVPFYERRGFTLHARTAISVYEQYLDGPVEGLLYVRPIAAPGGTAKPHRPRDESGEEAPVWIA